MTFELKKYIRSLLGRQSGDSIPIFPRSTVESLHYGAERSMLFAFWGSKYKGEGGSSGRAPM